MQDDACGGSVPQTLLSGKRVREISTPCAEAAGATRTGAKVLKGVSHLEDAMACVPETARSTQQASLEYMQQPSCVHEAAAAAPATDQRPDCCKSSMSQKVGTEADCKAAPAVLPGAADVEQGPQQKGCLRRKPGRGPATLSMSCR
jgi:hypothetical protein